jgi:hypothetical protein
VRYGPHTASFITPAAHTHRIALPVTSSARSVELHYGAAGSVHRTAIDLAPPRRGAVVHPQADSLFIVGDTHGDTDALLSGLRAARLVDADGNWSGGRSSLVFAGDMMDRGPDVLGLLWLIYRLERQARRAGGAVHVVLGNHEIMVMLSDLRYVHPRESEVARLHGTAYDRMFDVRESILGRWLATKPAVIRIGDVLIAHGGVADETTRYSMQEIDDTLARYMGEELFYRWADTTYVPPLDSAAVQDRADFFSGPRSVFWHRDYVRTDTLGMQLAAVLDAWDATLLVVGHTPVSRIEARYGGRFIPIHTPRYGSELLLLTHGPDGLIRERIIADSPPERF